MKKIITTLFIVLGFYGIASAQVKEKGDTEFGVEVGLNNSYVTTGNGYQNTNSTTGFNAGVSGDFYFSNRWSIKVKALYDEKGWGNGFIGILTSAKAAGYDLKDSFNTTDVGFRIDLGVKFPISDRAKFFIEIGGQGGGTNIFKDGASVQNETSSLNVGVNF